MEFSPGHSAAPSASVNMLLLLCFLGRFWLQLAIMWHLPGLAASPRVGYILEVGGVRVTTFSRRPLGTDKFLAKRRHAAWNATAARETHFVGNFLGA
jgi:hypothetical protein